ncbi:MAG: hypothetical protein LBL35_05200, partial [Clostridiales bacterium]|nr:hypothetical protein [Clostridiales bacterium]
FEGGLEETFSRKSFLQKKSLAFLDLSSKNFRPGKIGYSQIGAETSRELFLIFLKKRSKAKFLDKSFLKEVRRKLFLEKVSSKRNLQLLSTSFKGAETSREHFF